MGTAVGDALGMPYEGSRGHAIPQPVEMRDGRELAGSYTDDTQMMVALAESLLRCDGVDEEDLARTFREHYEPGRGYGSGTETVLSMWERGVPVAEAAGCLFNGSGSARNGAAMRVAPVAVRFSSDSAAVRAQAERSARVTHTHPEGVEGAVVQAMAVAAALTGRDPLRAALDAASTAAMRAGLEAAQRATEHNLDPVALAGDTRLVSSSAAESMPVAVAFGSRAPGFTGAMSAAAGCGGDTDTVAAMAGAIAGARSGASGIPTRWLVALEDGERGRSHIAQLAAALVEGASPEAPS